MPSGTATLNFGVIGSPSSRATVAVTGQTNIVAGSRVEAWLQYTATTDHSVDELREFIPLHVFAHTIVVGTGFTVEGEVLKGKAYGDFTCQWAWV